LTIAHERLKVIPYLNVDELGDRRVNLMPLWNGEYWRQWVATPSAVVELKVVDTVEADYVAVRPAKESDFFIPFVDLMWQRGSWPEVCPLICSLCDDFRNLGISVAKLRFFFDSRSDSSQPFSRFAQTEFEYITILARSVFDLLQEMISILWQKKVRLLDAVADTRRRSQKLPETFSSIVIQEKTIRTAQGISERFGLPMQLAEEYASIAPFFSRLRNARDAIVHGGSATGYIFTTERGFCVDPKERPFVWFPDWQQEHRYNDNLVSVLPWIADLVLGTIDACSRLMNAFGSIIRFPPEIAPGYRVFVRGPHNEALAEVLRVARGGKPWWD
jgi:hypothetical protein